MQDHNQAKTQAAWEQLLLLCVHAPSMLLLLMWPVTAGSSLTATTAIISITAAYSASKLLI